MGMRAGWGMNCMQGVKGLLEREEVAASVQRVEVPGGNWRPGAAILVYTSRGVLALEPGGRPTGLLAVGAGP